MFDIQTGIIYITISSLLQASALGLFVSITRRYPGTGKMVAGSAIIGVGTVLFALSPLLPTFVAVTVAQLATIGGVMLMYHAYRQFFDCPSRVSARVTGGLLIAICVISATFSLAYDSLIIRTFWFAGFLAVAVGRIVWLMLTTRIPHLRTARLFTASVLSITVIWELVRPTLTLITNSQSFLSPSPVNAAMVILPFVTATLWTAGTGALLMQRMLHEIRLTRDLEQRARVASQLEEAYEQTITGWAHALELRDRETAGHSERVTLLTCKLARKLGVPEYELTAIRYGALLHDVGKIAIPDHILLKPGRLDADEFDLMKQHPSYAYQWLSTIPFLQQALDIPYYHHERWDGTGYPCGLAGTDIPFAARIFAVVDAWDAMTNDRPYRTALSTEAARQQLREGAGTQFDPKVVDVFLHWQPVLCHEVTQELARTPAARDAAATTNYPSHPLTTNEAA